MYGAKEVVCVGKIVFEMVMCKCLPGHGETLQDLEKAVDKWFST